MNVNAIIHINQVTYSAGAHVEELHGNGTWRRLGLRGFLVNMCATPDERYVLERVQIDVDQGEINGAIGAVWGNVFINEEEEGEVVLGGQVTLPSDLFEEVLIITQARSANISGADISLDLGLDNDFESDLFSSKVPAWAEVEKDYGLQNVLGFEIRPAHKCEECGGRFPEVMRKIKGYSNLESVVSIR